MIEVVCPKCRHGLQVPPQAMGTSGTCNHCGSCVKLPPLWRYRVGVAARETFDFISFTLDTFCRALSDLIAFFTNSKEFDGMSPAEILLIKEARKQTRIAKAHRSDTTCCLGCLIILLLLFFTGLLSPVLAVLGLGGLLASQ